MGISVYEILVLLVLLTFILWIIAFVNILRSDFTGNNKLVWLLVVILVPLIGSIAYFFIGRKQKIKIEIAEVSGAAGVTESDFAARLRDLEDLKKEGLLSEEEYQRKRAEIMDEKW